MKEERQRQAAAKVKSSEAKSAVMVSDRRVEQQLTAEEEAILTGVVYSSLFQYPLKRRELRLSLPRVRMSDEEIQAVYSESEALRKLIEFREGHFFPRGQLATVRLRRLRRLHSLRKLARCRWALRLIPLVPFTRLVGLSGSSAHLNMGRTADIDFFLVTRGRTVWSVAVITLVLMRLLGCRRRICLNYLVSDEDLRLEKSDLFAANQVLHLRTLIGEDLFAELLRANPFVREIYPAGNGGDDPDWLLSYRPSAFALRIKRVAEWILGLGPVQLLEPLARALYRFRLLRAQASWATPEEVRIEKTVLKLHTHSHRERIEKQLDRRLQGAIRSLRE